VGRRSIPTLCVGYFLSYRHHDSRALCAIKEKKEGLLDSARPPSACGAPLRSLHSKRDDLQIEHVMPDEWTEFWPLADKRFAPRDLETGVDEAMRAAIQQRESLKHTLGNLSLLTPPQIRSVERVALSDQREKAATAQSWWG
jgi:hypothetical protein